MPIEFGRKDTRKLERETHIEMWYFTLWCCCRKKKTASLFSRRFNNSIPIRLRINLRVLRIGFNESTTWWYFIAHEH
jgi:hypothetical protein